jgi:hypothetical protein
MQTIFKMLSEPETEGDKMKRLRNWITGAVLVWALCGFAFAEGQQRFTVHGDGTVSDHLLGVMWGTRDNQGNIDWLGAERWVKFTFPYSLPQEKREDWRLPTLNELQSLYLDEAGYEGYETDCGHWVRIVPEIKLSCGWVWTSEKKAISARVFNFQKGYHYTDRMVHNRGYRALAVKSLE